MIPPRLLDSLPAELQRAASDHYSRPSESPQTPVLSKFVVQRDSVPEEHPSLVRLVQQYRVLNQSVGKATMEAECKYFRKLLLEVYNTPDLCPPTKLTKDATKLIEHLEIPNQLKSDIQKLLILLFKRANTKLEPKRHSQKYHAPPSDLPPTNSSQQKRLTGPEKYTKFNQENEQMSFC